MNVFVCSHIKVNEVNPVDLVGDSLIFHIRKKIVCPDEVTGLQGVH